MKNNHFIRASFDIGSGATKLLISELKENKMIPLYSTYVEVLYSKSFL
jgi:hypothetical protein